MFSTLKAKLLLGVYIFLILSIPAGAYLVSQQQTLKSSASQPKTKQVKVGTPSSSLSPARELQALSEQSNPLPIPSPSPEPSVTTATSFGPTLSFKVILESRPANNQSDRLFVGILEGNLTANPKFLLSFTVDLPAQGKYDNLSLAGLLSGSRYTALLKGSGSIAASSAFLMNSTVTNLNDGQSLNLTAGDLNDDNSINSADYSIAKAALGSSKGSKNWNDNADLNKDGVVNSLDLSLIIKNLGKAGASGSWTSPLPKTATPSAGLSQPVGSPDQPEGYWFWVPK